MRGAGGATFAKQIARQKHAVLNQNKLLVTIIANDFLGHISYLFFVLIQSGYMLTRTLDRQR